MSDDAILTMDELFDQAVDQASVDRTTVESLPPAGSYRTNPGPENPMSLDTKTGDDGRPMFTIHGPGEDLKRGNKTYIRARLSPVAKRKDDGKLDNATKLWAQAVTAYRRAFGEAPQTNRQVVEYLRKYPVEFGLRQVGVPTESNPHPDGDPGTYISYIRAVKE